MHKLFIVLVAIGMAACSQDQTPPSASEHAVALPAGYSRVADPSLVCMVNDQFMGKPQIPIAVAGRTYYGCCAMCKDRLGRDASARTASDPVTGEPVDKSAAIIVQDAGGSVLYFASEATLDRYRG